MKDLVAETETYFPNPWCLVQTRPNCLKKAELNLIRQGFTTFCPRQYETRRNRGRYRRFLQPLFNGYIFTQVNNNPLAWRSINGTYGVSRLVTFGQSQIAQVPESFITLLRARCDDKDVLQPLDDLEPGDRVRIVSGPFAEFVSCVERIDAQKRVWLMLDLFGRATKVSLSAQELIRI